MPNIYNPIKNAFAQSSYKDQQATALAGMLAFASDSNLVDAFIVGDVGEDGIEAGLAVITAPAPDVQRAGMNEYVITKPATTTTAAQIAGILVRNQQMRSNTAGMACYFAEDMCNVARANRSGARIWVQLAEGANPSVDGAAYIHVDADNAGKFTAATGTDIIAATNMIFRSAAVDGLALVELL